MNIVFKQAAKTAVLLAAVMLFFTGCGEDPKNNYELSSGTLDFSVSTNDGIVYYSLSTGEKVDDPASKNWDIAFKRTRLILTNSGASAAGAGSGGNGGVWHTNKTDFADVTMADKQTPSDATYNTDVSKWTWVGPMGQTAPPAANVVLNVMSFVGYNYGDGGGSDTSGFTSGTGYTGGNTGKPFTDYAYNQKQYYKQGHSGNNGPTFESTNQVYIIQHGDGTHHSKIQVIYEYVASPAADKFFIQYENLD